MWWPPRDRGWIDKGRLRITLQPALSSERNLSAHAARRSSDYFTSPAPFTSTSLGLSSTSITTRRFFARPASVLLSAIG